MTCSKKSTFDFW